MENTTIYVLIGAAGAICGIVFGYAGYQRGVKKDTAQKGKEDGELKSNTEYIRRRIDDVLLEQRETNKTLNVHAERLSRVEESSKQAHKRIDRIEEKGGI